jgi:cytochrome c oxidase assembly factor CtaG
MLVALGALAAPPPPLSPTTLVTEAAIEPLTAVLIAVSGTLYLVGVRRMAARGRRWRPARTTSFFAGLVVLALATQSGLAAYEDLLFSAHVAQHLLIGMAAPFLLALGAPITLALQATDRDVQVGLLRTLRSRPVRVLTHPAVALALFGVSLFALYFTPIYELSLTNEAVHAVVHLHFLVAGSVFFWAVIGLDPVSWRIPFGLRLLLVLLTVPFHSFLALGLMSGDQPIAADHYASVERPGSTSPIDDQRIGAGLMWVVGDLVGLAAAAVVVVQWMRHEDRVSRRRDAVEDRELARSPDEPA